MKRSIELLYKLASWKSRAKQKYLSEVNSDSGSRKLFRELGNDSETILSILKSILLEFF